MKELQTMLKNPKILKACQDILNKKHRKLFGKNFSKITSTGRMIPVTLTSQTLTTGGIKLATKSGLVQQTLGRNKNSKWDRRLKMRGRFRKGRVIRSKKLEKRTELVLKFNEPKSSQPNSAADIQSELKYFNFG